jgi:hypothetical protein
MQRRQKQERKILGSSDPHKNLRHSVPVPTTVTCTSVFGISFRSVSVVTGVTRG